MSEDANNLPAGEAKAEPAQEADAAADERTLRQFLCSQGVPASQHPARIRLLGDKACRDILDLLPGDAAAAAERYRARLVEHGERLRDRKLGDGKRGTSTA